MDKFEVSRRSFVSGGLAIAGGVVSERVASLTAGQVKAGQILERMKAKVGIPWREQTVDRMIAGSAGTPVTGIATIMIAMLEMIERAKAAGWN